MGERMASPLVSIFVGSQNDVAVLQEAVRTLDEFRVPSELVVASAHRQPQRLHELARALEPRGVEVVIAGAGYAAHLAGVIAATVTLPVIAVPIPSSTLAGLDSLLAMVQMPAGVPVATVTIGKAGARNAAVLAVQILARKDPALREALQRFKAHLAGEGAFP
jgi:phosphoribosylaminoimidazole carboxylase PurE protein